MTLLTRLFALVHPRAAHAVAWPLAALTWLCAPRLRRVSLRNLEACFPDSDPAQRRKLARAAMVHYVRNILEAGMHWHWSLPRLQSRFLPALGEELLSAAVASGKGVILLSPHLGAWEFISVTRAADFTGAVLYKPGDDEAVNQALLKQRERIGIRMVPANRRGLKALMQCLDDGKTIGALPDQEPRVGDGVFAPLFGVPALTVTLIPKLAARTGGPVLWCVCLRKPKGRYQIQFLPADPDIGCGDPVRGATAFNRGVEQCIALAPEQYLWAYKRFRARPEGEPRIY